MLPNDIHHTYLVVERNGRKSYHPAGRFLVADGQIYHLEDYYGLLKEHIPEGVIDDYTIAKLAIPPSNFVHASHAGLRNGHYPHLLPEADLQPLPQPVQATPQSIRQHVQRFPSVWNYYRAGHDQPHVLEAQGGKFLLDGNPLDHDEISTILNNVRTGVAKLRYKKPAVADVVAKMEKVFVGLKKADETERHFQILAQSGVPEETIAHLRRQIYGDEMVEGVGNKRAWSGFKAKKRPGVYISMDGNDFKAINDTYGHDAGDAAIKAFGRAAREAMDEVAPGQSKLFRNPDEQNLFRGGGDEFVAYVPTHEHAVRFARALRSKLDQIPAIGGTHKLSMSFGFGHDFDTADKALYQAKEQKYSAPGTPGLRDRPRRPGMEIGNVPSLAHSLVPGFEGPVPLDSSKLNIEPPPLHIKQPGVATPSAPPVKAPAPPSLTPAPAPAPKAS